MGNPPTTAEPSSAGPAPAPGGSDRVFSPTSLGSSLLRLAVAGCVLSMACEPPAPWRAPPPSAASSRSGDFLAVDCGGFSVSLDRSGAFRTIRFRDQVFEPPARRATFELNGETADAVPQADRLSFSLSSKASAGVLDMSRRGTELILHLTDAIHLRPDGQAGDRLAPGEKPRAATPSSRLSAAPIRQAGLVLTFPLNTVFHLAEYRNIGRQIDRDMPIGQTYVARLAYNFFVAQRDGMCMRFRLDEKRCFAAECRIARQSDVFILTFRYKPDCDVRMAVFSSVDEVLADHSAWLEAEHGLKKLKDRPGVPAWVREIKLVITADMLRSNWEIVHDFEDVLNLARAIEPLREPREILFYLPGLQGAYDSTHPTYRPHDLLGGERKFRELMEYLNARGFKLMMHTTAFGIDPYRPDIDDLIRYVRHDEKGKAIGWQLDGTWLPPNRAVAFPRDKLPLRARPQPPRAGATEEGRGFSFTTPHAAEPCEALFTVGGVKAGEGARIALALGRRTIQTPPGWFKDHDEYDFPFPLALQPGPNAIRISSTGTGDVDFETGWYRIRHAFTYKDPYTSWTWPILMGNMEDPGFIDLYADNVCAVVRDYGIGVVHFDAASVEAAGKLTRRLREKLPDTALAGEFFTSMEGMGEVAFCQGARQSLLRYEGRTTEQSSLPVEGLGGLEAPWQDKPSPVCRFVRDYCLIYPHLCAANAFVPVGKVCNICPPRQIPAQNDELMRVLKDARRLDYVPGLRVNYRQYGLDEATKRAIAELR